MINSVKARTPILALILFVFAVGYTFAAKVVVVPLGGDSQPAGMVSAFNSETCPTGWTEFTNARGRFVVGINSGGTLGGTAGGDPFTNLEEKMHSHNWSWYIENSNTWRSYDRDGNYFTTTDWEPGGIGDEGIGYYPLSADSTTTNVPHYTDKISHTPPYVQLLYCEKV